MARTEIVMLVLEGTFAIFAALALSAGLLLLGLLLCAGQVEKGPPVRAGFATGIMAAAVVAVLLLAALPR